MVMNCKYLVRKGCFVLLLVLVSASKTWAVAVFAQTSIVAVNETEGFVDLTLLRSSSSGSATVLVRLMTLQEFSERDTSVAGSCQLGLSDLGLTADLSTVDQAQGSDFSPASINVVFEDGETSKTFRVSITDDDVAEPLVESFVALVDEDTSNCTLPIVISDDDVVRLNFSLREGSETVRMNFTYSDLEILKNGAHQQDITVTISTRSTSATEDVDFVLPQKTFIFTSTTDQLTVPIQIFDQGSVETSESIVICLPSSFEDTRIRVEASTPQCFRLTLFDDDVPVVGYPGHDTEPIVTTTEGDPEEEICVGIIGGNLDSNNFIEISVRFSPSVNESYDRVALTDFFPLTRLGPEPITLQLAPSAFPQTCSTAAAVENEIVDGHVTFTVSLQLVGPAADFGAILGSTNFVLEVRDDDFNTITLSQSSKGGPLAFREGQGPVTIFELTVNRAGPPTTLTYVVTLRTEPPHTSDLILDPITIEPSMNSVPLTLAFVDDATPERVERFEIFIDSISIANGRLGGIPEGSGRVSLDIYDNDVPVGFSETQLTLDEGSMGSLDIRIPQSFLGELEADAQVSITLVLQRQEGEIGAVFVTVEPSGSPVVLSTQEPSTNLRLVASDDGVCTGVKRHTLSFTNSSSSSAYTAVADGGMGTVTILVTDDDCVATTEASPTAVSSPSVGSDPSVGGTDPAVGGTGNPEKKKTVCIPCIVIPILLILLCCLLCLLFIILWFCCCKKRCWHTYDPRIRERKFGGKPLDLDDVVKYGKIDDSYSPPTNSHV